MAAAYNKTVRHQFYKPGDPVLKMKPEIMAGGKPRGKKI
jgi:hypothetical protein